MKQLVIILVLVLSATLCAAAENPDLQDERGMLSYSIGYQMGIDFKKQEISLRPEILVQGIRDAMDQSEPRMSKEEMRTTMVALQRDQAAVMERKMQEKADQNLAAGKAYLAENARKEGVTSLPSGLQYRVISDGSGDRPGPGDMVEVHYRGTLIDGTEFDSSLRRGKPTQFRVDGVIPGWSEALQLMRAGGKWRLFIPPELAYGSRQTGKIEPNSTLIFEVELLAVNRDGDMGK